MDGEAEVNVPVFQSDPRPNALPVLLRINSLAKLYVYDQGFPKHV